MRRKTWVWGLGAIVAIGGVLMLLTTFASAASSGGAKHVRWDIISTIGIPPAPINPGGHASAMAPDGDTITLTGSGHFVAPASGGGSGGLLGGGRLLGHRRGDPLRRRGGPAGELARSRPSHRATPWA